MMYTYRDLMKDPPGLKELESMAEMAGMALYQMINPKSKDYKNLTADITTASGEEIAEVVKGSPRILKRPILTDGQEIIIGFKDQTYQSLLEG